MDVYESIEYQRRFVKKAMLDHAAHCGD
jgi:hypothetical protein